jgi:hypothetical protein
VKPPELYFIASSLSPFIEKSKWEFKYIVVLVLDHHAMRTSWGSGSIVSRILDFGT